MHTQHVYMSPALNGSSTLERFKYSNASEICNRMMFDFYPGLPHIQLLHRYHRKTYSINFWRVEPNVHIGVRQCLFHCNSLSRINLKHLGEQVTCMLGWRKKKISKNQQVWRKSGEYVELSFWWPTQSRKPTLTSPTSVDSSVCH